MDSAKSMPALTRRVSISMGWSRRRSIAAEGGQDFIKIGGNEDFVVFKIVEPKEIASINSEHGYRESEKLVGKINDLVGKFLDKYEKAMF